ncbi:hypothetical protein ACT3R6_01130, partial [Psychrobacter sp. AOP7-C1-12]
GENLPFPMIGNPNTKNTNQQELIANTYVDKAPESTTTKIGFDPVRNPRSIKGTGNNSGFRMPAAPKLSWSERNDRNNILSKISTPHAGSQNGQLTARQMELMADISGRDQKYANDQYGTQVNAASQIAQAQMSQDGANQRAMLGEAGSNARTNSQLGFDASKFQATADQQAQQQRQANSLASRRLDIDQNNSDVANFAPKQLNALYQQFDAAESEADRSAIAKQIQSLKGTANKKSQPIVITQTGQTATGDQMGTTVDNPAIMYDPESQEFINLPTAARSLSDPYVLGINADDSKTRAERQKLITEYMRG